MNERDKEDASAVLGMATTRYEERIAAATQGIGHAPAKFESHQAVVGAGVLFLLPALLSQGLLKTKDVYHLPESHYYGLESIMLTLAFMALSRIKNPEQLKQCKPGEIGKIIGLDRSPEVKCLRNNIKLLAAQKQAQELNRQLINEWYKEQPEEGTFLYIDGHQRIYYGSKANLPVKYISRQKLCLAATTEYWVHDTTGQPVLMVMGELTEKLEQAIEEQIIPELRKTTLLAYEDENKKEMSPKETQPVCTLIFDREGYHPAFFKKLWDKYKIAVITYRKNIKDKWPVEDFETTAVTVLEQSVPMDICEEEVMLGDTAFREIRRQNEGGHQTSIITNNYFIKTPVVAGRMFGRWTQENFFKYLISDFDFDKIITYGTEQVDENKEIINPKWRKADYKLKKQKEKTTRLKAKLYPLAEQAMDLPLDKIPPLTQAQIKLKGKIEAAEKLEKELTEQRSRYSARIRVKQMDDKKRYDKLKHESKMMMNIIKMICYRAETSIANLLAEHLPAYWKDRKRMLVKQIIKANADLIPDEDNKTLTIVLHSLSAKRFNLAAEKLAELLTQTETVFPGSDLRLIFKTSTN